MTYVDAILEKDKNCIHVVERVNGKRVYNAYPSKYVLYFPSERGKYTSIYGQRLDKFETTRWEEFQRECRLVPKDNQYESDINPIFRCFYENYKNAASPNLHVAFFDLEVDFHPERGFSGTEEAFNPITAVSVYCSWLETNFTLVLKPKMMSQDTAQQICERFDNTVLCESEKELLDVFLTLIEDADILTGWNSEGYDIPYLHNRIVQILSKEHTKRLCLWNKFPRKREYESFGKPTISYDLVGRVHLDYLQLYRKHTYHEMHSYRLDFVGEYEVGDKKVAYEGSLDKLYNEDFEKFIAYNRQDVMLLVKIDNKLKFIDLANDLAHTNGVLIQSTMGSVVLIDNAITNEAHDLGLCVPTRRRDNLEALKDEDGEDIEPTGIAGAYVADPVEGMHKWIGGVDINSLYPSAIRSLNMSKETVVGQIRPVGNDRLIQHRMQKEKRTFADSWNEMFGIIEYNQVMNREMVMLTVDFEDGTTVELSADELYQWIFENPKKQMTLSANGTIFDLNREGVVPGVLSRWYSERKTLQAEAKKYAKMADEETDPVKKQEYKVQSDFYDRRQLIKKILLNATYGSIANSGSAWFDSRIAQSTTLTGRCIVKHMGSKINEVITGEYHYKGGALIYSDTDSQYFSAYPIMSKLEDFQNFDWSKEAVVQLYDQIADITNESFPSFMKQAFNVPETKSVIKAGRELVASNGLFITKKRYAVLIFDKEGKRKDVHGKPGEIKVMGLDLKRSDTPKPVQDFLSEILTLVLTEVEKDNIFQRIKEFRTEFSQWPSWSKGSPKRVNNLTQYGMIKKAQESVDLSKDPVKRKTIPGHVLSSLNWNLLCDLYNDYGSMRIQDGQKVIVCKLRSNPLGMTSVAYPVDQLYLPDWFKTLPFDDALMESTILDKKLENLLGVLQWNLEDAKNNETFDSMFSF
jgi:DNA polymerase elongation subunit (family B)